MNDVENATRAQSQEAGEVDETSVQRTYGTLAPRSNARILLEQMPLLAFGALCLIMALFSPRFLSASNVTNVLVQASVMAVVAMGMTCVIIVGGFDLSVGSNVALSGCIASGVMLHAGMAAGIVCGVATGAFWGFVNGTVVTRLRVSPFITTLGSMAVIRGVALLVTDGRPVVGESGLPEAFLALGRGEFLGVYYLVWVPLLLFFVFTWLLHWTAYGKRVFATGGNLQASFLSGIAVERVITSAYVWCGALAGVAGVMLAARLQSGQPTAGEFYELTAIAAVVLGGASLHGGEGKLYKSMIGVLIMIVLGNGLNLLNVHSYWQRVVIGAVIIAAAAVGQLRSRRN